MDYLSINRANWDSRAEIHVTGYGLDALADDPDRLSDVVRFDAGRLGDLHGLDGVHLQCHLGTDTLSLHRLGARMTGVDLSPVSLAGARALAARAGADIDYVEADVYSAPEALGGRTFDLVYTGIGAICWLPSIARWARTAAALLRPGGRLFIRDGHPVLNALVPQAIATDPDDRAQQPWISGAGETTLALELPYFEQEQALVWREEQTYGGEGTVGSPESVEWNHGLGEIVTAVLDAGLVLTALVEHDSIPWDAFAGLMALDPATGEYRLAVRPERLPASFTLVATRPS